MGNAKLNLTRMPFLPALLVSVESSETIIVVVSVVAVAVVCGILLLPRML